MSARSRVAFATGVAGLIGALLLLSGWYDGSVALALLFVVSARLAAPAALVDAGPVMAAGAQRSLMRHASFAPAWALVVGTAALRAGSVLLSDARGANAVTGLAVARGPALTVAAAWFALAAAAVAIVSRTPIGAETAAGAGAVGRVIVPTSLSRLEIGGVLAQAALVVTLFAGPQVRGGGDVVSWVIGIAALASLAWLAKDIDIRRAPVLAVALGAIALLLAIVGGAP